MHAGARVGACVGLIPVALCSACFVETALFWHVLSATSPTYACVSCVPHVEANYPIDSATALSVIIHPRNPHAPSMHFHIRCGPSQLTISPSAPSKGCVLLGMPAPRCMHGSANSIADTDAMTMAGSALLLRLPVVRAGVSSFMEMRQKGNYWRMIADLNPSIASSEDTAAFKANLGTIKHLDKDLQEDAFTFGDRYFYIPALDTHRGACHLYVT